MPGRIIDGYRFFFYSNFGTLTFQAEPSKLARIAVVGFRDNDVILTLTDGRAIHLDMAKYAWLKWFLNASAEQRSRWEIVPLGGDVWWPELDEGIELQPLLDLQSL